MLETEGLKTEVRINGIDYRIDLIVLEKLKDGEPIKPLERYWEVNYGEFLELLEKDGNVLQGELVDIIKTKFLGEYSQTIPQLVSEFTATIQANNQKIREINQMLDAQYLESATGD